MLKKLSRFIEKTLVYAVAIALSVIVTITAAYVMSRFALLISAETLKSSQNLPSIPSGEIDIFAFTFVSTLLSSFVAITTYVCASRVFRLVRKSLNLVIETARNVSKPKSKASNSDENDNDGQTHTRSARRSDRSKNKPTPRRSRRGEA